MRSYTYLLVDFSAILVPLIFSFHPKLNFHKTWFAFFPAMLITAVVFISADMAFTRMGVWGFNPDYVTGIYFFNLPLEECLFFLCIPYACIFTYHCLKILMRKPWNENTAKLFSKILSVALLIAGIIYIGRWYTATTFIALSVFLFVISSMKSSFSLGRFFTTYLILLIPFFICNGILTGTGISAPVVWYNDAENLGFRMLTIPFEDIFYGMLLILMNATIYEQILRSKTTVQH